MYVIRDAFRRRRYFEKKKERQRQNRETEQHIQRIGNTSKELETHAQN